MNSDPKRTLKSTKILASASTVFMGVFMGVFVGAFTGCTAKEKLDTMHDATLDMKTQTKQISDTSDQLNEKTGEMYDALKQGDSLTARRSSLKALAEAEDSSRKLSEAAKYFMSFEFQLWSGFGQDTAQRRDEVATSAAREFMRDVQEFMISGEAEPAPFSQDDKVRCFNSLAATMHYLNPKQEDMLKHHKEMKSISIFGMIDEALAARDSIDSGTKSKDDYPHYVREILAFEDVAVALMQARYNYLGAMALASVTKIRESKLAYLDVRFTSWDLDLSDKGLIAVQTITNYFKGAMQAHDSLIKAGVAPVMDSALKKIFANMRLGRSVTSDVEKVRMASKEASVKETAVAGFVEAVEKYRGTPDVAVESVSRQPSID